MDQYWTGELFPTLTYSIDPPIEFAEHNQVLWAMKYSKWYHQFLAYPLQALKAAIRLKEFIITDQSTYLTLVNQEGSLEGQTNIYKSGENKTELLLPGHLLVGNKAQNKYLARSFVEWVSSEAGQKIIANFNKDSKVCLYKPSPSMNEVMPTDCKFTTPKSPSNRVEL